MPENDPKDNEIKNLKQQIDELKKQLYQSEAEIRSQASTMAKLRSKIVKADCFIKKGLIALNDEI